MEFHHINNQNIYGGFRKVTNRDFPLADRNWYSGFQMSMSKNSGLKYRQNSGFRCTESTENRYSDESSDCNFYLQGSICDLD